MARKGKLDKAEAKLVRGIVEGKSVKDAAVEAGISKGGPETARVAAYDILQRPHVAAALDKALDEAGASIKDSAKVIGDAHSAFKVGLSKFGAPIVIGEDHPTRMKAAELNLRARRLIGSGPEEGGGNQTVNLFAVLSVVRDARNDRGLPL